MKVLTVVIPAYNMEKWLDEGVKSLLSMEILDDIEILIIDDGSKDRTAEIGEKFQELYPRTVKLISKKNGGHGSTINKGIELATGRYFKVIDGDDWVETEGFTKLVQFMKTCDSDIITNNCYRVDANTLQREKRDFTEIEYGIEYDADEALKRIQKIELHTMNIKTDILKNNNIIIDENKYYVDVEYILYPIPYVKTITFCNEFVYMYRVALESQSMNIHNLQKNLQMHYDVLFTLISFLNTNVSKLSEVKRKFIEGRLAIMARYQYKIYLSLGISSNSKKELCFFDAKLKQQNLHIYNKVVKAPIKILRKTNFSTYAIIAFASRKWLKVKN